MIHEKYEMEKCSSPNAARVITEESEALFATAHTKSGLHIRRPLQLVKKVLTS